MDKWIDPFDKAVIKQIKQNVKICRIGVQVYGSYYTIPPTFLHA